MLVAVFSISLFLIVILFLLDLLENGKFVCRNVVSINYLISILIIILLINNDLIGNSKIQQFPHLSGLFPTHHADISANPPPQQPAHARFQRQ